jgi:hypothetical protein
MYLAGVGDHGVHLPGHDSVLLSGSLNSRQYHSQFSSKQYEAQSGRSLLTGMGLTQVEAPQQAW